MGLSALRDRLILAKIANREYEGQLGPQKKGATVNIAIPAAVASRSVSPDVVPPAVTAVTPTSVALTLGNWKEAPFAFDDKGLVQVERGILPMQASEAIKAIANDIEDSMWALAHGDKGFYGYAGVAGTTPFATDLAEYNAARAQADAQLMEADESVNFVVLDTLAKANALGTNAVQNASWRGSADAFRSGKLGTILGAQWDFSQRVPVHTSGTAAGATTNSAGYALGIKTVTLASAGTGTVLVGDVITFAGDSQPYVVTAGDASVADGGTVSFEPGLKVAIPTSPVAITLKASHRVNLLVHRDAFAFAMAPLKDSAAVEGVPVAQEVAIDEMTGLALRLEVTRQHKQYQWSFDALWGAAIPRRENGVRIAG
jgi:hypothetical protein